MWTIPSYYHTFLAKMQRCHVIIENCVITIQAWHVSRCLQLNPDKLKLSKSNMAKLCKEDISLKLGTVVINRSDTVRDLCVILDTFCQNSINVFSSS